MAAMGTSPRRILLSVASASGIALAANFLGITSRLLDTVPESTVEASGLDTYFPRGKAIFLVNIISVGLLIYKHTTFPSF